MPIGIFTGFVVALFPLLDKLHRFTFINDTSYSFPLHGVIGVIAAFLGMVGTGAAKKNGMVFGITYQEMFSAEYDSQASHQLAALVISLAIAIGSGLVTGGIVRILKRNKKMATFYDNKEWRVPDDFPACILVKPN
jgi:hypothetical protein